MHQNTPDARFLVTFLKKVEIVGWEKSWRKMGMTPSEPWEPYSGIDSVLEVGSAAKESSEGDWFHDPYPG